MYRYYLTQRPAMPGTFPKPQGNKVLRVENFDQRTFCEEAGREAWAYVEYEKPGFGGSAPKLRDGGRRKPQ